MPTTDEKIDALYNKFILTDATPTPAPPSAPWHRPTAQETAAFASRIGWPVMDLEGDRAAELPTTEFPSPVHPAIAPCDGSDEDMKTYHKFGFVATGARPAFTSDSRDQYRNLADQVWKAGSADAADLIVKGCAVPGRTPDTDVALIVTGQLKNFGKFGVPELDQRPYKPGDAPWQTLADAFAGEMKPLSADGAGHF
jgi:hypothetical protein